MKIDSNSVVSAPVDAIQLQSKQSAGDSLLAPIDHLHDRLAGSLARVDRAIEQEASHVALLGAVAQFGTGAGSAVLGMVDGAWQTLRHPIGTLKGVWAMTSHIPLSPVWLIHGARNGFKQTLVQDRAFWAEVVDAYVTPYRKDWKSQRYFAVAGRAALDIAALVVSARQVQQAVSGATRITEAEQSLKAAVLGTETATSGQVVAEGQLLIGSKSPGERMLTLARKDRPQLAVRLPKEANVRDQLQRAARHYSGDRQAMRVRALAKLREDQADFLRLNRVGAARLRSDLMVRQRYKLLMNSVDNRMEREIEELLGIRPVGDPKDPLRAAAKLEMMQSTRGPSLRLGSLDDLTRGRINLPNLDVRRMRDMLQTLVENYGRDNLIIHDYIQGKPMYRGRLHVKLRDASGIWYELQLGPVQVSAFYDTPFRLGSRSVNLHDAIYKGVLQLNDEALKSLGRGNLALGQARVSRVLDTYVQQLEQVIQVAKAGGKFDFEKTAALRRGIEQLVEDVPPELLPIGLR